MSARVPKEVIKALDGLPEISGREAAALIVSVDVDGFPRVTLLSRAELDADERSVRFILAGRTTPTNLTRSGQATLFVVEGDTAYSCGLAVRRSIQEAGMHGYVADVVAVRQDSLGIPLSGISYVTPPGLPSTERWAVSRRLLEQLRAGTDGD